METYVKEHSIGDVLRNAALLHRRHFGVLYVAAQPVIPCRLVAQPIRHRQHPLSHRHPRQHRVHQCAAAPSSAGSHSSGTT